MSITPSGAAAPGAAYLAVGHASQLAPPGGIKRRQARRVRDRTEDPGGTFNVASSPGHGTVLTISLPWPALADGRR